MNLKDKIIYGYLTFNELATLIEANIRAAAVLNIRIWYDVNKKGIYAHMSENKTLLFDKQYSKDFMHVMLAKMHYDWSLVLQKRIDLKNQEEHRLKMLALEELGGQNQEFIDIEDRRPTLGEKLAQRNNMNQYSNEKKYGIS